MGRGHILSGEVSYSVRHGKKLLLTTPLEIIYKILFETNFEGFKNMYGSEFEKLNYNCCFQTEDEELQEEEDRQKLLMDARVTFFSC